MTHRGIAALIGSIILSACSVAEESIAAPILESNAPFGPLPKTARPLAYDVALRVDPRESTFSGVSRMTVELDQASDGIWIHGDDLRVQTVMVNGGTASYEEVLDTTGVSRIIFGDVYPAGEVEVTITYEADFDRNLAGLFSVKEQGESYALAKSESIQARRFLPGFDEPGFKAPFDIMLIVPEGFEAISNAPIAERSPATQEGFDAVSFETTRPLSTYLLSVAVGPFDVVNYPDIPANSVRETALPLRGFARKGRGADIRPALNTTAELVEIFETALDQPYPYKKLDIVAAPAWPSGATELAGAITYRESRILLDENSGPAALRAMLQIHTHELAHMWFGNLVTPPWWDDLWLKEAFATWGTPLALTAFDPKGGHGVDATARAISAMGLDSLASTRAVREDIFRNRNIRNAYDAITYSKGMAIIAMADAYFGAGVFRPALGRYIAEFADGKANSPDFYEVIGRITGEPQMTEVFQSFVEQKGVPLMSAALTCEPEAPAPMVSLRQDRYRPLGSAVEAGTRWTIPVCVAFGGDETSGKACGIMSEETFELPLESAEACPAYILPNADGAGYYRWSLPANDWANLKANFSELNANEALSAVDSAIAAFRAGQGDVESMLAIMEAAAAFDDRRVAIAPMFALEQLITMLEGTEGAAVLRHFAAGLYKEQFEAVRTSAQADDKVLAAQLEEFLALTAKDPGARRTLSEDAARFVGLGGLRDSSALSSDRYESALTVAVQDLGGAFYGKLIRLDERVDDPRLQAARAVALGATIERGLAEQVRDLALSGSLGPRETDDLIRGQMANPETRKATWAWLKANYAEIVQQLPSQWKRRTPGYGEVFCDAGKAAELQDFFAEVGSYAPGYERALNQTSEAIKLCAALKEARGQELVDALDVG
ncbi:MAG: M1 family metallopeptidase [Pseudomonadota bacterium]